jgi:hypothetical protein
VSEAAALFNRLGVDGVRDVSRYSSTSEERTHPPPWERRELTSRDLIENIEIPPDRVLDQPSYELVVRPSRQLSAAVKITGSAAVVLAEPGDRGARAAPALPRLAPLMNRQNGNR